IGFYSYARYKLNQQIKDVPKKLGIDIEQKTEGFTFCKSEGGRKLFCISASKALRYKESQRATLQSGRIVVYGRAQGNAPGGPESYDQIYGAECVYEPDSGEVRANGEVLIDLERTGTPAEDPLATKPQAGSIHLKTSGLTFNQKTGIAQTK